MSTIKIGNELPTSTAEDFSGYTGIERYYAADGTGTISKVIIQVTAECTNIKIGTFEDLGSDNYKNRDYELIPSIAGGTTTILGLNIDTVIGDYIGFYGAVLGLYRRNPEYSNVPNVYQAGDKFTGSSFAALPYHIGHYLYGEGTSTPPPVSSPSAGAKKAANIFQRGF